MATIINNPPASNDSGGGMGMIIGLVIMVVLAILFFAYGLPAIKQMQFGSGGTQINIPSQIDVNVKQTK